MVNTQNNFIAPQKSKRIYIYARNDQQTVVNTALIWSVNRQIYITWSIYTWEQQWISTATVLINEIHNYLS